MAVSRDIVVIGASAGGVEALVKLISQLPGDFPAALFAVLHVGRTRSLLPEILARSSELKVAHAADGDSIEPGRVLVAPPDRHLLLERDAVYLGHGPEENGSRPAVDPLFRSAARAFGPRVIGVILTGALDDGAAGLREVKEAGGIAVVQDPEDAAVPGMPLAALDWVEADVVAPLTRIPAVLRDLVAEPGSRPHSRTAMEARNESQATSESGEPGRRSLLTCPSCSGVLWELDRKGLLQFRCQVGHVYSAEAMFDEQAAALDRALWAGLRALEERAELSERMADGAEKRGHARVAKQFRGQAVKSRRYADALRSVIADTRYTTAPDERSQQEDRNQATEPAGPPGGAS